MKVIVAKSAGFCWGVKRAVQMAIDAIGKNGKVYSLGELIHNPQEIERLEKLGIKSAKSIEEIPEKSTVIIRSHGVPPETFQRLKEKECYIVDATCPFVKAIQEKAVALEKENYPVCILGNSKHPEVIGIAGHIKNPIIIENLKEIENLKPLAKLGVVCQTTLNFDFFKSAIGQLSIKAKELKVFNTICKATRIRQEEAKHLANKVDLMIVVGGKNSSNTTKLYLLSKTVNKNTFHIESPDEIKKSWFKNVKIVGVTAGASTPQWIIEQVLQKIDEILKGGGVIERGVFQAT